MLRFSNTPCVGEVTMVIVVEVGPTPGTYVGDANFTVAPGGRPVAVSVTGEVNAAPTPDSDTV